MNRREAPGPRCTPILKKRSARAFYSWAFGLNTVFSGRRSQRLALRGQCQRDKRRASGHGASDIAPSELGTSSTTVYMGLHPIPAPQGLGSQKKANGRTHSGCPSSLRCGRAGGMGLSPPFADAPASGYGATPHVHLHRRQCPDHRAQRQPQPSHSRRVAAYRCPGQSLPSTARPGRQRRRPAALELPGKERSAHLE